MWRDFGLGQSSFFMQGRPGVGGLWSRGGAYRVWVTIRAYPSGSVMPNSPPGA